MIIPQTSCCCWFQAPLPTRTGRAPRHPDRWSRVRSVRSRSPPMPYMICSSNRRFRSPPLTASTTNPQYSIASQSKPSRYSERSMNAESLIQVNR